MTRNEIMGYILKFLRKEKKLSQKTIAENIGIAQQTYAGYEIGKHEPSIEITIKLANFYGLPLDYIAGRYTEIEEKEQIEDKKETLDLILKYSLSYYERTEQSNREQMKIIEEIAKKK